MNRDQFEQAAEILREIQHIEQVLCEMPKLNPPAGFCLKYIMENGKREALVKERAARAIHLFNVYGIDMNARGRRIEERV